MDLFEYQARDLFAKHGVPVLDGIVATTPAEARAAAEALGGRAVVKAQVKVGGRGKAGGVKLASDPAEAAQIAEQILGMDIKGHTVHKVMLAATAEIVDEFYVSFLLDRANRTFLAMATTQGGMDVEQVAAETPELLAKVPVDANVGCDAAKAAEIVAAAGFGADVAGGIADVLVQLWGVFANEDATLVEVNPLVQTADGKIVALDGKVSLDENADFRHPDHEALTDKSAEDPLEARAKAKGLNYVKLDGEVGIIGNGAGLVMSTLDVVAYAGENHGGVKPANFLDIGGGASARGHGRRARDHPVRPGGQVRVRQRVRRHHRLRRRGRTASSRRWRCWRARATPSTSPSSCASTATTRSRAGGSSTRPPCPASSGSTRWTARPSARRNSQPAEAYVTEPASGTS